MESHNNIFWDGSQKTFGFDLLMINSASRNKFYYNSLRDCKNKVVLDIGAGTGLLSVIAADLGAKIVYAFEKNYENYKATKYFIEKSELGDRIKLFHNDFLHVNKEIWNHEKIDIIVTETFANDCFTENFALLIDTAKKNLNLSKDINYIPNRINLSLKLFDVPRMDEFQAGIALNQKFSQTINKSIQNYRDNFYYNYQEGCMPLSNLTGKVQNNNFNIIHSFTVDEDILKSINNFTKKLEFNFKNFDNPYILADWILVNSYDEKLLLAGNAGWKHIGYKIDKNKSHNFTFKFHPLTHGLIGYQF